MLMNLMPLSLPTEATWRHLDSVSSNPTKQPTVFFASMDFEEREGDGVAMMLWGTSVRKGWPLARKFDPSKVMDRGLLLPSTSPITSRAAFLVKLGGAIYGEGK